MLILSLVAVAAGASMLSASSGTQQSAPVEKVTLVAEHPHDPTAFCQGLVFHDGKLLEGTGQYGESKLRLVDLQTGQPTMNKPLANNIFGEGVTVFGTTAIQLTWKNGYLILYDVNTWQETGRVRLRDIDRTLTEGWGITHDNTHLIISDGSSKLRFVDPVNRTRPWKTVRRIYVKDGRRPVKDLNELEYVNGKIFANVWYKDQIAVIDPKTGKVEKWLDIGPLRPPSVRGDKEAALNGIAWDEKLNRLFVTGKDWPKLFEIKL